MRGYYDDIIYTRKEEGIVRKTIENGDLYLGYFPLHLYQYVSSCAELKLLQLIFFQSKYVQSTEHIPLTPKARQMFNIRRMEFSRALKSLEEKGLIIINSIPSYSPQHITYVTFTQNILTQQDIMSLKTTKNSIKRWAISGPTTSGVKIDPMSEQTQGLKESGPTQGPQLEPQSVL